MLIDRSSPLCRLPVGLDPTQLRFLDAMRLTVQAIDITYGRLEATLTTFGDDRRRGVSSTAAVMLDAWAVLDCTYRLRRLLTKLPHVQRRAPARQVFLRATTTLKGIRDSLHHLDTDIARLTSEDLPPWGAVTWLRSVNSDLQELAVESLIPGQVGSASPGSNVQLPEGLEHLGVSQIELWASGASVNLSNLYKAVAKLVEGLEAPLAESPPESKRVGNDTFVSVVLRLEPIEAEGSGTAA